MILVIFRKSLKIHGCCLLQVIQGGSVLVAPGAPEELERRRDRSAGRRRRPGGPGTCLGMLLVMPRQVSGVLGTPKLDFSENVLTDLFFKVFDKFDWYTGVIWEIH